MLCRCGLDNDDNERATSRTVKVTDYFVVAVSHEKWSVSQSVSQSFSYLKNYMNLFDFIHHQRSFRLHAVVDYGELRRRAADVARTPVARSV